MDKMRAAYDLVLADSGYVALSEKTKITGTWDDHDYGLNDGGSEWECKDSVQQILLDFLKVEKNDPRRIRKGVYHSMLLEVKNKIVKIIVLDTRYFRSALTKDPSGEKRYVPNPYGQGTMLGESQWQWLKEELSDPEVDFNLIVSSIQFLSGEHGFESWSNMPHEVDRMIDLIQTAQPRGVLFLSGDRHIAEFSSLKVDELSYPLIDFTASGMTHSYSSFSGEPNKYRISEVISDKNFGLLKFDLDNNEVTMEIRSENNEILGSHSQKY
jgi:alkaline phosphatase D